MRELEATQGRGRCEVVCAWCGGVIRPAAAKPSKGMCQACFARMMREHSRAQQFGAGWRDASDR